MQTPLLFLALFVSTTSACLHLLTEKFNSKSFTLASTPDPKFFLTSIFPSALIKLIFKYFHDPDEFNLHKTIDVIPDGVMQEKHIDEESFFGITATNEDIRITFTDVTLHYTPVLDDHSEPICKVIHGKTLQRSETSAFGTTLATNDHFSLHSESTSRKKHTLTIRSSNYTIRSFKMNSTPRIAAISGDGQDVAIISEDERLCLHSRNQKTEAIDVSTFNIKCMAFSDDNLKVHLCGERGLYMFIIESQQFVKTEPEHSGSLGLTITNNAEIFVIYKERKLYIYRKRPLSIVKPYFPFHD